MLERLLGALVNMLLSIVNIILWVLGIDAIGNKFFGTFYPEGRLKQFIFGLVAIISYAPPIIFVTIVLWVLKKPSLAQMVVEAL